MESTSNFKTLRVILSSKVVRDFVQHNILPDLNEAQRTNGSVSAARNSSNQIEQTCEKSMHDSEIVDSMGMRPIVLLNRLSTNDLQRISTFGYLQCID